MGRFSRNIVLLLFTWLSLAGVCPAKQVYLQDGGIVECQGFWQKGDEVIVKVNRDTVVEFQTSEINMKKTFARAKKPSRHIKRKVPAAVAPAAAKAAVTKEAPAVQPAAAPPVAAKVANTAPATPIPAAKPAPPAVPAPAPVAQRSEEAAAPPAAPAAPASKEELEKKRKEAATMMAEAIQKNDHELMKKAVELQKSTIQPAEIERSQVLSMKLLMIILVSSLLVLISLWVVFNKAGVSGWMCLIPVYNMYLLMKISGKPGWWAFLLFIPLVGTIFYLLAMLELAEKFGRGTLFGVGLCLLPMFFFPLLAFAGSSYEEQFSFS